MIDATTAAILAAPLSIFAKGLFDYFRDRRRDETLAATLVQQRTWDREDRQERNAHLLTEIRSGNETAKSALELGHETNTTANNTNQKFLQNHEQFVEIYRRMDQFVKTQKQSDAEIERTRKDIHKIAEFCQVEVSKRTDPTLLD